MSRRSDRLYVRSLGPREQEALRLIEAQPGLTVTELAAAMGVRYSRAHQIVARLALGRVRRGPA